MKPVGDKNTYGRSGFYLHDSTKGYTHGCIEADTEIFDHLINYRGEVDTIPLRTEERIYGKKPLTLLFITYIIFSIPGCTNMQENHSLYIRGVSAKYNINDIISFVLVNTNLTKAIYGIGVEKKIDNRWKEYTPNVEGKVYKPEYRLRAIKPKEEKYLSWNPKKTPLHYRAQKGEYRFVIFYQMENQKFRQQYSTIFHIE